MKTTQLINPRGNPQKAVNVVSFKNGVDILTHYETAVAAFHPDLGFIRTSKNHSTTTSKNINMWLRQCNSLGKEDTVDQSFLDNLLESV